jgi:transcriptional regulator with XRE-family HTH domain
MVSGGSDHAEVTVDRLGRVARAIRLRLGLTQDELGRRAGLSRSAVSLLERGSGMRLSVAALHAIVVALGARLDHRIDWRGPELDRLLDARHAALGALVKRFLERHGWIVRVEVSFSEYGERGRIDLLAFHGEGILLAIELKTDLVDVQALLGALDVKTRLAPRLAGRYGWQVRRAIPVIVFAEDRTVRRHLARLDTLFDRFSLRGRDCLTWLRRPEVSTGSVPNGLLWFAGIPSGIGVRTGQRVRRMTRRRREPAA